MRSKALLSVLLILIAAALIGGATMAWFTAEAELAPAEFTAGTLLVDADGPEYFPMEGRFVDNVNPGDCATVCWDIKNIGTKGAEVRAKLDVKWLNEALGIDGVVFLAPAPDSPWVLHQEDGVTWFYYAGEALAGTYGGAEGGTARLCVVVAFDGPAMGNEYQGETLKISGIAEAIQYTNGAPDAIWGEGLLDELKGEDYNFDELIDYFLDGSVPCYPVDGGNGDPPVTEPDPRKVKVTIAPCQGMGTVTGLAEDGMYTPGDIVTLTAVPGSYTWYYQTYYYEFSRWTSNDITIINPTNATLTFEMPDKPVALTANFSGGGYGY